MAKAEEIDTSSAADISTLLEMISNHCPQPEILAGICRYLTGPEAEPAVALFVLREDTWLLAAHSEIGCWPVELLCRTAHSISERLFDAEDDAAEQPFAGGWARHLHSGAGGLL